MPDIALLNIDINFINKPEVIGNQYVEPTFISSSNIKTFLQKYMDVNEIIKKLNLKHKYTGQITNSTEQILPFYQRLIDKGVIVPKEFSFVHIGSHCNIYSYGGHDEYETKEELHNYDPNNAFAYLFVKKYIDKMVWVYPEHYTEDNLDKHFSGMDYYKKNGYYFISINQGLRFIIQPVKWSQFIPSKHDWKAITIITNHLTAKYTPEDLQKIKELIF